MLTPGLGVAGTLAWQVANQSLNVAINSANANKSTPLGWRAVAQSYCLAVGASCGVAYGLNALVPRLRRLRPATRTVLGRLIPFAAVVSAGVVNVFLMRAEEIRRGIDVYPVRSPEQLAAGEEKAESLGKSRKAATLAVGETAASRVLNATPVMAVPPLILLRLQRTRWLAARPRMVTPVNLGLILATSYLALPFALGVFPQFQSIAADSLEEDFHGRGGSGGLVEFNRGM
ncbi:hypothetical protein KEM52_003306 [Ascosphaera acerosa]|nr:hypothetical protein KEM52_003306 [Ascosphaera acerosa]